MNTWQVSMSPQKKRNLGGSEDEDSIPATVVGNLVIKRPPKSPDPPAPISILNTASQTSPITAPVHLTHCCSILSQSVMTDKLEDLGSEEAKKRFGGRRNRHLHPKVPTSKRSLAIRTPKSLEYHHPYPSWQCCRIILRHKQEHCSKRCCVAQIQRA